MSIFIVDTLEPIWDNPSSNEYSILESVKNSYGVYIFRNGKNGDIIYVGEARKQCLKKRVIQNFTVNDTGGTFRKNYIEENNCDFNDFKTYVKDKQIIFLTIDKSMVIKALESMLIFVLKPQYNKDL